MSERSERRKTKKTRTRMSLQSLAGLLQEAGQVYRKIKAGKLDHEEGRSLVWVLAQMRAMVEAQHLERIENRLNELAAAAAARGLLHENGRALTDMRLPN